VAVPRAGHDERVVVIEHDAFRHLWDAELDGGLIIEREDADKIEPGAVTIFPDEGRRRYDIAIPQLARALGRLDPGRHRRTSEAPRGARRHPRRVHQLSRPRPLDPGSRASSIERATLPASRSSR